MNYVKQANKPDWWSDYQCRYAATSGTSPFNEWYGFISENEAIEFIEKEFISQLFHDNMMVVDKKLYFISDLIFAENGNVEAIKRGALVNDIQHAIHLESKF